MLLQAGPGDVSLSPLYVIGAYLVIVLAFGAFAQMRLKGTSADYFLASRSIGPFLLLMSVFGTTMTAFAMVGSTAKAYQDGIGVFGLMASTSGIVHSLVFFLIGVRLWAIGKRHDFVTQIQFFRARFESPMLGYLLFPVLVGLVIPYLLIGVLGAGSVVGGVTRGMFPDAFASTGGAIPAWLSGLVVTLVVLAYILGGGVRAAALANAVQTIVFMLVGVLAVAMISDSLGGPVAATEQVAAKAGHLLAREGEMGHLQFLSYTLVPLSVAMFPHLFQHWLTAKHAKTFRMTVVAHPIFIAIVWLPCVLIGIWAMGADIPAPGGNANGVLARMVGTRLEAPFFSGLLTAGILAAIMSSLDSQFVCLGTMFTHDIVLQKFGADRFNDAQKVRLGRLFILFVVAVTYVLSLFPPPSIFDLAVWCFSGFAALFPLVFAAIYWRRATRAGALASVVVAMGSWLAFFVDGLVIPALHGQPTDEEYLIGGMMPVVIMVAASAAAMIVVSLVTSPPSAAQVDRFLIRPDSE